jgi:dipeptidyl aminopeptidase/acylaminoacyl peptidase
VRAQISLVRDISPDRTELLLGSPVSVEPEAPLWTLSTLGESQRRLGSIPCRDAAWASGGKTIRRGDVDVLQLEEDLYRSDGGQSRKLVTLPGEASWVRWSPDGKKIRFTLTQPEPVLTSIWEIDADGTHPRRLIDE